MIHSYQKLQNGVLLPTLAELGRDEMADKDAKMSRDIRSFYLMANAVVSKTVEIEGDERNLVLVVDDEPLTFELIQEFLQEGNLNCEVLTELSARKAYDVAVSAVPDLIITDWLMPDMDGLELIKRLKANPITANIPVILMTGMMGPHGMFDRALRCGANDYVRKPLDYTELIGRVTAGLALNESLKEIEHQKAAVLVKNQFVDFLVDGAPNPIFYQDKWGRFLGCNKNFERLSKKTKEEIIGRQANEFLPEPVADVLERHFSSLRECGQIHRFQVELPHEGRSWQHLAMAYVGLGGDHIEVVIGSITDITEIVQSGREILTQLETLRRKEKEQFANNVEKLQSELDFRHRELTMHLELLIHSRNVKAKLIEGVNKLQPYLTNEGKSKLRAVLMQLQWELNEEEEVSTQKKFDEVNAGLYSLLEKVCPDITKNEKRLCAYLKLNHGSADIAKITDRSLNSVNVGFARLRAKLGLPKTKDLRIYLSELSGAMVSTNDN